MKDDIVLIAANDFPRQNTAASESTGVR